MSRQAEADLIAVLEDLGLSVWAADGATGADMVVDVDGQTVLVDVKAVALATPQRAALISSARPSGEGAVPVLVADSIAVAAKEILRARGWGWLDRRHGHLVLRGSGLLIDAKVPTIERVQRTETNPLTGRAAKAYAAALLMTPDAPPSIREVAREVGMASATVGDAALRLREAALVREDGRPLYPELFWELADLWTQYEPVPLRTLPTEDEFVALLEFRGVPGELHKMGPALAGTAAAVAYGAPLTVAGDIPPDFYLPSPAAVSSIARRFGRAEDFEERTCAVTVAPTQLVCTRRFSMRPRPPWALAHPLFVALDLAQDRSRGREILNDFTPPKEFTRVW